MTRRADITLSITFSEGWQILNAVTVRRDTLDKLRTVCEQSGPVPVLDEAIATLDDAKAVLEAALFRRPTRDWTESELRLAWGDR